MKFSTLAVAAALASRVYASPVPPPEILEEIEYEQAAAEIQSLYSFNKCTSAVSSHSVLYLEVY